MKAVEKIVSPEARDFQLKKVEKIGEVEDYLITIRMPGFNEEDIDVRVSNNYLIVRATREDKQFRRTYELPRGFKPKGIRYRYEDGFLVIRLSLKPREEA
jgi:HSP20 family molecular chaperone IbpA